METKKIKKIIIALWILLFLVISFWGISFNASKPSVDNLLGRYDFKPFSFLYYYFVRIPYFDTFSIALKEFVRSTKDFFFNIILFVPFGLISEKSFKKTVLYGVLLSFGAELLQLVFGFLGMANRVCDINDVISAFFGILIGYCLGKKLHKNTKVC